MGNYNFKENYNIKLHLEMRIIHPPNKVKIIIMIKWSVEKIIIRKVEIIKKEILNIMKKYKQMMIFLETLT